MTQIQKTNLVQFAYDLPHVVLLTSLFEVQSINGHDLPLQPTPLVSEKIKLMRNLNAFKVYNA